MPPTNAHAIDRGFEHEVFDPEASLFSDREKWMARGAFFVLGVLAFAAFELTTNPALSTILLCVKFGFRDFGTAAWLWRRDPNKSRGFSCWCWYSARAFFKICTASFIFAIGVVFVFNAVHGVDFANNAPPVHWVAALALWLACCAFATVLCFTGACAAWFSRSKVWVGVEARHARKRNAWPPEALDEPSGESNFNRARGVAISSALSALGLTFMFVILGPGLTWENSVIIPFVLAAASSPFWGWALVRRPARLLGARILAASPADCWGEQS